MILTGSPSLMTLSGSKGRLWTQCLPLPYRVYRLISATVFAATLKFTRTSSFALWLLILLVAYFGQHPTRRQTEAALLFCLLKRCDKSV